MDARTVWSRETGEQRPKEQLLIETMFCVYYLSKGSAVLTVRALGISPVSQHSPEPRWRVLGESAPEAGDLANCIDIVTVLQFIKAVGQRVGLR